MLKKDTLGAASAASLGEAFKCGECLHHSKSCHPHREARCVDLGVRSFAIAPKCFTPDVTKVITNSEQFVVLASLFQGYTSTQKKILMGILRGAKKCQSKEFKFGTKLYLRTGGDNLSSYRCGYVVGYTSSGELILAGSADRKSVGCTFFAYLKSTEGLLTHKEWVVKKEELIAARKYEDLRTSSSNLSAMMAKYLDYEVPSIDTSQDFFDTHEGKNKRRRNKRTQELTEFIVS